MADEPLPVKVSRTLWRGDSRTWTHVFTEDDAPVDLTGHTFVAQYRADKNRGDIIATADCDVTDPTGGIVVETLTAEQADLLGSDGTILYWDLQSTDGDGLVRTWLFASVKVKGDASDV